MYRNWLEEKRTVLGLTHQEVANDCNITRAYYTQIENGIRNPSVAVAKKIAKKLKFKWTVFFEKECNVKKQEFSVPDEQAATVEPDTKPAA